jgi:hypothetical protein
MKRASGYFALNALLYFLLAFHLASFFGRLDGNDQLFLTLHLPAGGLLALAGLAHAGLHQAFFRGGHVRDIRSAIKQVMIGLTGVATLAAVFSGIARTVLSTAGQFHAVSGTIALAGLFVHSVKNLRWMNAFIQHRSIIEKPQNERASP